MQPFPHPNDASYKIWSSLANWPQRYLGFIWIMTEWQNHRILEGQGKSSIAPTFSKRGYKKEFRKLFGKMVIPKDLFYTLYTRDTRQS